MILAITLSSIWKIWNAHQNSILRMRGFNASVAILRICQLHVGDGDLSACYVGRSSRFVSHTSNLLGAARVCICWEVLIWCNCCNVLRIYKVCFGCAEYVTKGSVARSPTRPPWYNPIEHVPAPGGQDVASKNSMQQLVLINCETCTKIIIDDAFSLLQNSIPYRVYYSLSYGIFVAVCLLSWIRTTWHTMPT